MIPYFIYKLIHLLGIMLLFLAFGAVMLKAGERLHPLRKRIHALFGCGLFLALLGGFGLLARIGVLHGAMPGWAMAKVGIWTLFGLLAFALTKKSALAKQLWWSPLVLGVLAAYLAGQKPF